MIDYEFIGDAGETLKSLNIPQRVHGRVDGHNLSFARAFQDDDDVLNGHPTTPISATFDFIKEGSLKVIQGGHRGAYDNYHQSYRVPQGPKNLPHAKPGCPECIHIHWRWGKAIGSSLAGGAYFPDLNGGQPLIPDGSSQDVEIAVAAYRATPDELRPQDFHSLINGENVRGSVLDWIVTGPASLGKDLVLWYSATGHLPKDTFFRHGGFFGLQ
jgi:hypothetical protein